MCLSQNWAFVQQCPITVAPVEKHRCFICDGKNAETVLCFSDFVALNAGKYFDFLGRCAANGCASCYWASSSCESLPLRAGETAALVSPCTEPAALRKCSAVLSFQAAELADYTARIAALEDAKKRKEEDAILWQNRVSLNPFRCLQCCHWDPNMSVIDLLRLWTRQRKPRKICRRPEMSCTWWWWRPLLPRLPPCTTIWTTTATARRTTARTAPTCTSTASTITAWRRTVSPRPRRTSAFRNSWRSERYRAASSPNSSSDRGRVGPSPFGIFPSASVIVEMPS